MTRSIGRPRIITDDGVVVPEPVQLNDRLIHEGKIQKIVDENPDVLPIAQIGLSWGPLISLGREVSTSAGRIDNLFVSPTGELTVVEAKLWRNPEARRKVVAQVLDYAASLSKMSYEDLESAVAETGAVESIWGTVQDASAGDEAQFIDTVSRNLRSGRFLLLIVGDGIKEGLEDLAGLLGNHPDLGFHLELVELRLYQLDSDLLVIPSLVGRTNEITRATITVVGNAEVTVSVEPDPEQYSSQRKPPLKSLDAFVEAAEPEIGLERAKAAEDLARRWDDTSSGYIKMNVNGFIFRTIVETQTEGAGSLITMYTDGWATLSVGAFTDWIPAVSEEQANEIAGKYGFETNGGRSLIRELDLTDADTAEQIFELLIYLQAAVEGHERLAA